MPSRLFECFSLLPDHYEMSETELCVSMNKALDPIEKLFEVQTVNGFLLQQETKLPRDFELFSIFIFSPREIQTAIIENRPCLVQTSTPRFFGFSISRKLNLLSYSFSVHPSIKSAKFRWNPTNYFKFSSLFLKTRQTGLSFTPTFTLRNKFSNFSLETKLDREKIFKFAHLRCLIGKPSLSVAAGFFYEPGRPIYTNIGLLSKWKDSQFFMTLINDKDLSHFVIRMTRKIREKWNVGVSYQINQFLESSATIAYKASIGKATIHCGINTNAESKTSFTYRMWPRFRFGMSSHISHHESRYRFGMFLLWDNPDDK